MILPPLPTIEEIRALAIAGSYAPKTRYKVAGSAQGRQARGEPYVVLRSAGRPRGELRNMSMRSGPTRVAIGALYLVGYVAFDYLSFVRPYHNLGITPWNPSTGLSLALIFFGGVSFAPATFLAPAIAEYAVRSGETSATVMASASITFGVSYLGGGLLLQRLPFNPRLDRLQDVLLLIAVALAAAALAAITFALLLAWGGAVAWHEFREVAWRSFVGNLIGTLVTAPLVMLATTRREPVRLGLANAVQLAAIVMALVIVFGYREATAFQLFYLLFLPLLWIALSHGTLGAVVALVAIQIGLVIGAEIRFGADPGLTALQVLMIALAITGLIVGAIVSERAIAARRLREQQAALNRAFRLRSAGEVAATIAHEINQPLTAISAYSGIAIAATEREDWELAADTIRKVRAECDRANTVLRSIRDVLAHGGLSKTRFTFDTIFAQISDVVADELTRKSVRLRWAVDPDVPAVFADATQLQQAVHNLIMNSADAIFGSGFGSVIDVSVRSVRPNSVVIEVRDDGPGFPPSEDGSMPAPFVTTKPDGSGLGLLVARSIAEAHGGSLAIRPMKRGAAVEITLPIMKDENG